MCVRVWIVLIQTVVPETIGGGIQMLHVAYSRDSEGQYKKHLEQRLSFAIVIGVLNIKLPLLAILTEV